MIISIQANKTSQAVTSLLNELLYLQNLLDQSRNRGQSLPVPSANQIRSQMADRTTHIYKQCCGVAGKERLTSESELV